MEAVDLDSDLPMSELMAVFASDTVALDIAMIQSNLVITRMRF